MLGSIWGEDRGRPWGKGGLYPLGGLCRGAGNTHGSLLPCPGFPTAGSTAGQYPSE